MNTSKLYINRKGRLAHRRDSSDRVVVLSLATLLGLVGMGVLARAWIR